MKLRDVTITIRLDRLQDLAMACWEAAECRRGPYANETDEPVINAELIETFEALGDHMNALFLTHSKES